MRRFLLAAIAAVCTLAQPALAEPLDTLKLGTPYIVAVSGQANTAASHAIAIEAGAQKGVRILRVCVTQPGIQTTAGLRVLLLERTTAAGTAGAVTPEAAGAPTAAAGREDAGLGAAFSGVIRAKPTALGTQGATIAALPVYVPTALAAFVPICIDFTHRFARPPRVPPGTANGIALRDPGATGGASFAAFIELVEE